MLTIFSGDNKPAKISTVEPTEKHGVKSQQKY